MPDDNGYPTEEELNNLKLYCAALNIEAIRMHLSCIWWIPDWGLNIDGEDWELHTGGWSGNEEIIGAMKGTIFWSICWTKSTRGGHHYFNIPSSLLAEEE